MKNLRCVIDTSEKLVTTSNGQVTLVNDKMYRRSEVTDKYPEYFVLDEANAVETIYKGQDAVVIEEPLQKPKKKIIEKPIEVKISKPRKKKEVVEQPKEPSIVDKAKLYFTKKEDELSENMSKIKFSWSRFTLFTTSAIIIAVISGYLRSHGVATIFKLDITIATIVVIGFIITEFAISSLILRDVKSKLHHFLNIVVLGIIQLILIGMAFMFEFSTMSNWLLTQKNEITVMDKKESIYEDSLKDYEVQIKAIQAQIELTPADQITRRSYLTNKLVNLTNKKNAKREEISTMYADVNVTDRKVNRTGMENTAKVLGISEDLLIKSIVVVIAGILNILYLFLFYATITEWKRRD